MVQPIEHIESPFTDRLNSNYAPTDDELVVIKGLLSKPNQKLHSITSEIEGIQAQLERLLREKDDLNEHLKAHKALLSPVRRLPPDVLQKIFMYCLPVDRNPVMSHKEAPVLLGRICSQWRDIVLGTPRLWAAIHIAIPMDPAPSHLGGGPPYTPPQTAYHSTRVQGITAWLSRSDPCPLSISLFNPHYDTVGGATSGDLYLDAIVPFAQRWKSLRLSSSHQAWSSFWPRVRESDVPLLEKIYLDCAVGYPSRPDSPDLGYGRECGLLRALNLRSVSLIQFDPHVLRLPLRWNRLMELNLAGTTNSWQAIKGLSITESLALLSLCPNLEYFSVQISLAGFSPLPNGEYGLPRVTMNKLQGLSVTESGSTVDTSPFFQHVIAPSLCRIKFRRSATTRYSIGTDFNNARRDISVPLSMLIRQSNKPIEEFELDATYITEMDVMKCLSLMPDLKRLALWTDTLSGSGWTPPHANAMRWGSPFIFGNRNLKRFIPSQFLLGNVDAGVGAPDTPRSGGGTDIESEPYSPVTLPLPSPPQSPLYSSPSPPASHFGSISNTSENGNNDGGPTMESAPAAVTQVIPPSSPTFQPLQTLPPSYASDDESSIGDQQTDFGSVYTPSLPPIMPPVGTAKGKGRATDEDLDTNFFELINGASLDALCPQLEVFECCGVYFTDAALLAFLRSRSSLAGSALENPLKSNSPQPQPFLPKLVVSGPSTSTSSTAPQSSGSASASAESHPGDALPKLAHLRKCRISFAGNPVESPETRQQLNHIRQETGMILNVLYPPPLDSSQIRRFSPYDGLPSIPTMAGPLAAYVGNGDWTTSHSNGLSGEAVFLYSALFH